MAQQSRVTRQRVEKVDKGKRTGSVTCRGADTEADMMNLDEECPIYWAKGWQIVDAHDKCYC